VGVRIAVVNRSSLVDAGEMSRLANALSKQLAEDYSPIWGLEAEIRISPPSPIPPSDWQLVILDDSDQANALGYHELTKSGAPLGKIFVRSVQQSGGEWSVATSHELLEMMADPDINLAAEGYDPENPGSPAFFAYENCDPVEGDTYRIGAVAVSDFVYPAFFELNPPPHSRFDRLGLLGKPFTLRPGGYMSVLPIGKGHTWKQIFGDASRALMLQPKPGGRRSAGCSPARTGGVRQSDRVRFGRPYLSSAPLTFTGRTGKRRCPGRAGRPCPGD
jgi:hypothetical protein